MTHLTYLAVLVGCLLVTLPLEFVFGARVYRSFGRAAAAVLIAAAPFLVWDYAAYFADWWYFDYDYLIGVSLGGLPLEELAFFVVIPLCGLLTYEAVSALKPAWTKGLRVGRDPDRAAAQATSSGDAP